jgi:hypothetical protein
MTLAANGYLGLGATSPSTNLTIGSAGGNDLGIYLSRGGTNFLEAYDGTKTFIAGTDSTNSSVKVGSLSNHPVNICQANGSAIYIDTSKNVGIGTTTPTFKFNVYEASTSVYSVAQTGSAGSYAIFLARNPNNDLYLWNRGDNNTSVVYSTAWDLQITTEAAKYISFNTTNTERARITSDGNFGIGRTSPSAKLDVAGDGIFTRGVSYNTSVNSFIELGGTDNGFVDNGKTSTWRFYVAGDASNGQSLRFDGFVRGTGWTERARIDSNGRLLVGTTSATGKITVSESTDAAIVAAITATNSGYYNQVLQISCARGATTGYNLIQAQNDSTTECFKVTGAGDVRNTNNSYGAISDIKVKENIVDATPKLAQMMQVKVRNYNLIGNTTKQLGVVAQELETVFPSMVDETPDRDTEGNDLGTTTKSVKYSVFVPMLIKAMQEQQAIIESLKARLDAANL